MRLEQVVHVVQVSFPQVYLACHTRHQRKRSTTHRLSVRDSAILAHLDERRPMVPSKLAEHLDIARSTLSEALKRLVALGYVERRAATTGDGRNAAVVLSARGAAAIRDTSVLETERLRAALEQSDARELRAISAG